jgi:hypothetical protein
MMQLAENFGPVDVQALDYAGKRLDVASCIFHYG